MATSLMITKHQLWLFAPFGVRTPASNTYPEPSPA
jgi:hypothetical protein